MSVPAFDKKDEAVGPSPCCKGYLLRRSVPCNADYCENCDTWATEPRVVPHTLGPSWQRDADGRFIRPAHTLGPQIARWVKEYIKSPDGTGAFVFSPEQLRLLYWIYAVDDSGRWVYRELTIQRLKGWGKDPFAALLALIEMVGPCRFSHWDEGGNPVGRPEYNAWVQVMAVSKDQTKNTMRMFAVLASEKLKSDYNVVIGKEQMTALRGQRLVEAVTSSPETREGNRPTFQIGNEPHHWRDNNSGHDMRGVMDRNLKQPASRILWITNAYNPAEESVGQANREGYELDVVTQVKASRMGIPEIMYDTLEAPENARVIPREIIPVLLAVRGDSVWVNVEDIKAKMLDSRNSVITSRRFYFNQIGADEESWVDPKDVDATIDPQVKAWRRDPDIDLSAPDAALEVGWVPVKKDDPIVMFLDGGKTDDHTAISGYRLSDGYLFAIGHWGRPSNLDDREPWFAPRTEVDERVQAAMDRFTVVAFWADPSHARDDETDVAYWDDLIDSWHRRYKDRLLLWAVRTGTGQHSVRWDMTSPAHQQTFVQGAEAFQQAMREREVKHDGNAMFVRYMKNAKSYQTKYGTSLWKGSRGSKRKIDGAVTHVGARMLGGLFLNREEREQKRAGYVWGY